MFQNIINKSIITLFGGLTLASSLAVAAPIIDQNNSAPLNVGFCNDSCEWQQSVTAGLSGKLTGVKLYGTGHGELRIGLGNGFYAGPWDADITNVTVGQIVDLSAYNIFVTAGQNFVIDTLNFDTSFGLRGTDGAGKGQLYLNSPSRGYHDAAFGAQYALGYTTYVDTSAHNVPEPASLALLGLGLAGFVAARRRKQ